MSPPRASACDQAAQLLQDENPEATNAFLDHLPLCLACQAFVAQHERQFEAIFERDPIDDHLPAIQDAMERLTRIEFKLPEKPRENWEAPAFPGYELLRTLNETRHSRVFLARQSSLNRQVALKCVRLRETSGDLENLAREAAVLAGLNHPNILTIFETGTWDKGIWLALEYCEGGSLAERLEKPWPARSAARLIRAIAQGSHAAHKQGVIHRDIKPANILFTKNGQPKLGDFGLADGSSQVLMTKPVTNPPGSTPLLKVVGTPSYITPEQVKGKPCDNRVDVHGLGAVLYHLLTGRPPFLADNAYKALSMAANQMPVSPAELNPLVPEDLNAICMKCLAKDPEKRYDTARDLARDLGNFLEGAPVLARPLGKRERMWKWARRNRGLTAALAGVVVLLMASAVGFAWLSLWAIGEKREAERARKEAETVAAKNVEERQRAEQHEARALKNQAKADAQSYVNKISRAYFEWEYGSAKTAMMLLESCPPEYRGWEHDYLTSKIHKNQVILKGHKQDVNGVAVSPDGKLIASTSEDGEVRLWNSLTGQSLGVIAKGDSPGHGAAFSGNGRILAVALKGRAVLIIDMVEKKVKNTVEIHVENPHPFSLFGGTLFLNHDGSVLFAELENEGVGSWDTANGKSIKKYEVKAKKKAIRNPVSSRDGKRIAAGGDGVVTVWEVDSGKISQEFLIGEAAFSSIVFSSDGKNLITGLDNHTIKVFDTHTGKLVRQMNGHTDSIQSVALSPDGKILASASDDYTIKFWDWQSGKLLKTFKGHGHSVRSICFSPTGNLLISGSWDKTVRIWKSEGKDGESRIIPRDIFRPIAFSPTSNLLAFGGIGAGKNNGKGMEIGIWDARKQIAFQSYFRISPPIRSLAFSPTGKKLSSGGKEGQLITFDVEKNKTIWNETHENETIQSMVYSRDGARLFTAVDGSGNIWVLDADSGRVIHKFQAHKNATIGLATSPNGKWLATGGKDGQIKIWNSQDFSLAQTLEGHINQVRSLAFSNDGTILASACDDGKIVIWNPENGLVDKVLTGHGEGITRLRFTGDQRRLMSSSFDKTVKIWDLANGQELLKLAKHTAAVRDADFNPDCTILASGGDEGVILLWEADSKMETQLLQAQSKEIEYAGFIGAEPFVFAKTKGGDILCWDIRTGRLVPLEELELGKPLPTKWLVEDPDGKVKVDWEGADARLIDLNLEKKRKEEDRKKLAEWAQGRGN